MNRERIVLWSDRCIRIGFYALFFLIPLIVTPWNYELFEYNKMMLTYGLTVWIVGWWAIRMIAAGAVRVAKTPLDIPIALFVLSQLISTMFSIDQHVSWFGYYSRFNGGMFSVISYVLLYYAFVSNWKKESRSMNQETWKITKADSKQVSPIIHDSIILLLKVALGSAIVVSIYAILERLGIDKHLWVQDVQNRVFSTLGQPNWLAAYLVTLSPIAWAITLISRIRSRSIASFVVFTMVSLILFTVLLFTKSRSGFLGYVVADGLFWLLLVIPYLRNVMKKTKNTLAVWLSSLIKKFLLMHLAVGLVIIFVGTPIEQINKVLTLDSWKAHLQPQKTTQTDIPPVPTQATAPLLEVGGTESGTIRKYVWQGAINAWQSTTKTKAIGTGTETFAFAFFRYRPVEHNMTSEWDFLYNKAHNEYLNYLTTTGVFGLGSYLLFIAVVIVWSIKNHNIVIRSNQKNQIIDAEHILLPIALLAGWISILVTNFFGFSVVIIQLFFFLFPAMLIISRVNTTAGTSLSYRTLLTLPTSMPRYAIVLPAIPAMVILFILCRMWWADVLFNQGYRKNRQENFALSQTYLSTAIQLNPTEPFYHDELASALSGLGMIAFENTESSKAAELIKESIHHSDTALHISPQNVNMWKTRTKLFYAFSALDPRFNQLALDALEQARTLSPNDPKILYNLAILYGRNGDNTKAIELLQQTIMLKPNYRDGYYALWVFYEEEKKHDLAKGILEEYLQKVDPNDKDFMSRLQQ